MKIKDIQLSGFKSFPARASLQFDDGITAIVGPNGCGKSNVVDAFRWTMGEQSAKHLRGGRMEDVIFSGTESGAMPIGMAEVSITLSNENGEGPEEFKDFSEISIGRRLFRDGESEYLINKKPVRLRDVLELFMDTGIGVKAYSIIEQGQIAGLVNSRPKERRYLFEEAAGVSKYKSRKEAALRKIEATKQNLVRISDIVVEVRRQINMIDRMARKAARYRRYRDELQALEVARSAAQYLEAAVRITEADSELGTLRSQETGLVGEIRSEEEALAGGRSALREEERHLAVCREAVYEARSAIERRAAQSDLDRQEWDRLDETVRLAAGEIDRLQTQDERLAGEEQAARNNLSGRAEEVARAGEILEQREGRLGGLVARTRDRISETEELRRNEMELGARIAASREAIAYSERGLTAIERRLVESREEFQGLQGRVAEAEEETGRTETRLSKARGDLAKSVEQSRQAAEEQAALEAAIERQENELDHLRSAHAGRRSRIESLKELEKQFAGLDEGVRAILGNGVFGGEKEEKIFGLVGDLIEVEPRYEAALEAVLGERLSCVLVESAGTGIEAIEYLKSGSRGRGIFAPLELKETRRPPETVLGHEGVLGLLGDRVTIDPRFRSVIDRLLGGVVLVDRLDRAMAIWREDPGAGSLVTPDGELINRLGILAGGRSNGDRFGLFRRKRELVALERAAAEDEQALKGLARRLEEARGNLREAKARVEEARESAHANEIGGVSLEKRADSLGAELEELHGRADRAQAACRGLESERAAGGAEIERQMRLLSQLESERVEAETRRTAGEEEIEALRPEADAAREALAETRSVFRGFEHEQRSLREHLERVGRMRSETHLSIEGKRREIDEASHRKSTLEKRLGSTEREIEELRGRLDVAKQDRDALELAFRERSERVEAGEEALQGRRQMLEAFRSRINDAKVALAEMNLNRQHLRDTIRDRYRVDLDERPADADDALPDALRDVHGPEAKERIDELRRILERMGEVNMAAIEEHEELQDRYRFLTEQQADLEKSIASLEAAIAKINRTSRRLFRETFESIREKFKEFFPRLFDGGRADLFLSEEDGGDPLEAGIEIVAQPKGKRLRNINLLSGGEKTLTALALLFSIFLVKPSPFFLLDEVDAALDDANVIRFNEIIRELARTSQFILITHNKKTIEIADVLYGITMEEPGMSKIVSVRLHS